MSGAEEDHDGDFDQMAAKPRRQHVSSRYAQINRKGSIFYQARWTPDPIEIWTMPQLSGWQRGFWIGVRHPKQQVLMQAEANDLCEKIASEQQDGLGAWADEDTDST